MTTAMEQVKTQALALSVEERAELARDLWDSVEGNDGDSMAAWNAEIRRRIAEIEAGTAQGRPVDEFLAEMREKYPSRLT